MLAWKSQSLSVSPALTTLEKVEQAQTYLPRLIFAGLAGNDPSFFKETMSLKRLEKLWLKVEKSGDDTSPHAFVKGMEEQKHTFVAVWGWGRVPEQR